MIAGFFRDIVRSLRSWRRTPGAALLVVLALGLSGGAVITLVSLFNALFWRELPVPHPEALVGVFGRDPRSPDYANPSIPVSLFASLDRTQSVFQAFAGFERVESTAVIQNASQRLVIDGVSGRYFETLGVRPALGQVIGARDVDSVAPVATISFRCWQTRFAADPNVIGQSFRLRARVTGASAAQRATRSKVPHGVRPAASRCHVSTSEVTARITLATGAPGRGGGDCSVARESAGR
jgi:putative ABC transport system permease protein